MVLTTLAGMALIGSATTFATSSPKVDSESLINKIQSSVNSDAYRYIQGLGTDVGQVILMQILKQEIRINYYQELEINYLKKNKDLLEAQLSESKKTNALLEKMLTTK